MKEIKLIETNQIVQINEEDYKELDLNDLDTSDIRSKKELIIYLNNAKKEHYSRQYIKDKLSNHDIHSVVETTERFSLYDAIALSANTLCNDEYQIIMNELINSKEMKQVEYYDETIYLEYKYRSDLNNNDYSSVIIDNIKYNELKQLHKEKKCRVFVCYLFKDNKIRMIELFNNEIDYIMYNKLIRDNVYNNKMKKVDLYCFNNNRTILI